MTWGLHTRKAGTRWAAWCAVLLFLGQAEAGLVTVDTALDQEDGTANGVSLRDAVALAQPGDTITFSNAVVPGIITLTLGPITLSEEVRIIGPGQNELTLSGGGASRIFTLTSGADVDLFGMTLIDGDSGTAPGGAINNRGTLKIISCTIENCSSDTLGGGLYNDGGTLNVETSTLLSCGAVDGGGVYNVSGRTILRRSLLRSNTAVQDGGGIYANGGEVFVINTTLSGNQITGMNGDGGGIYTNGTAVNLTQATVFGNSTASGGQGGGLFSLNSMTLRNSLVAGNSTGGSGPDISGTFVTGGNNFVGLEIGGTGFDFSGTGTDQNYTTAGVAGVSEVLEVTLRDNGGATRTHALVPGSPAVDAGDNLNAVDPSNFTVLQFDQRDEEFPRIENGTVDIGAFELSFLDNSEAAALAMDLLEMFNGVDTNGNNLLSVFEVINAVPTLTETEFNQLDANGDASLSVGELLAIAGPGIIHNADTDGSGGVSLKEVLRVVQLFNAGGYQCAENAGATEDGFAPGALSSRALDPGCFSHAADYNPADGVIGLGELLRVIQFFSAGGYTHCPDASTEDGFCAGP